MPRIELLTLIDAPAARVFDLSRSIDLHVASTPAAGETAIAGRTSGLIGPGEEVTWRARHLGCWHEVASRITAFDRPRHFRDSMVRGAFKRFDHDHHFGEAAGQTEMRDTFDFDSPFGLFGRVADAVLVARYVARYLKTRNAFIKATAESDGWRRFLERAET